MSQEKEWIIMDISRHAVEKAIGCSPAFFQKVMQAAVPATSISGIRIYMTPLLPVRLTDGSEVHAVVIADGGNPIDFPIWSEENIIERPHFLAWPTAANYYRYSTESLPINHEN